MENKKPVVLFVVGSLRKQSFNRQLAEEAEQIIGGRAEVRWLDFSEVPYMNQDIEFPPPEAVTRAREQVTAADGVWFFSPEYNYSFPGLLKNLIDWLSRPLSIDMTVPSVLNGKMVTYSGVAGSSAAHYMMSDANKVLRIVGCWVVGTVLTGISLSPEKFASNELALSENEKSVLETQVNVFLDQIAMGPKQWGESQ